MTLGINVLEISSEEEGGGEEMDSECGQTLKRPLDSSWAFDAAAKDDCEVAIIEKPPDFSQPARKRGKVVNNNGLVNDECCILDCNPEEIVAVLETIGNESEELAVTAERGHVACRDYPHSRHCCVIFPFNSTPHEEHCTLCHCYVCDKPAPCSIWGQGNSASDHCHASDKETKWKKLRDSNKLNKAHSILSPIVDILPPLSTVRSTVAVSRSNQEEGIDAVAYVPSNIRQNPASEFRPSSLTDPASLRRHFSSASLSSHLTSESRGILANSTSSIDPARRSDSIFRKAVTSASSIRSHGAMHQLRSCSSTEHLNTDFQSAINGHSTSVHTSSRRSAYSTINWNPDPETGSASMNNLYSFMPGQFSRFSRSGSIHGISVSSPGQAGRSNQMCIEPVTSALSNISHVSGHQSMPCSSENNLNPALRPGMVPAFGLQAHFPGQIEWIGKTGTKLASSMNSTVQSGSSKKVGPIASDPTKISQGCAHQIKPSPFTNNSNPAPWTQPPSAFDLSSHLLLQNARIGQSHSMLANSMTSTCRLGGSDQASTGTVACIPWNVIHSCADQFRPSSFTNNLNPLPQTQPTNQFRSSSFANNLKSNPPPQTQRANQFRPSISTDNLQLNPRSQTQLPFTVGLSSHLHGQTGIRIASSTTSMDQVGQSHEASTNAAVAVSLYNGCSSVHPLKSIQEELCSSTKSQHCVSYKNIASSLGMAYLPGQIGSMHVDSTLGDIQHFHGSKISSLENNSMETIEPSNMLSSSNNEQITLETCTETQKVNQSADEGDSIDVLSRNATSIHNVTAETQLSSLQEFLLDNDFDDNLYIEDTLFTDTFNNFLDHYSYSEVQPTIQDSSSEQLLSSCSTHLPQVASNIHISEGVSTVPILSNSGQFPPVEQIPATSPVPSRATD